MSIQQGGDLAGKRSARPIIAPDTMVASQSIRREIANIKRRVELIELAAMTLADGNLLKSRKWEMTALRLQDCIEDVWHDVSWLLVEQNSNKPQFNEAFRRQYLDALILACKDWIPEDVAPSGAAVGEALTRAVLQVVTEEACGSPAEIPAAKPVSTQEGGLACW